MTAVASTVGQPNASKQVYEFALRASCSDGKIWPEEQYKTAERLDPTISEADKRKYQEFLLKLGGLVRDQFLVHDPKARARNYILKELPEHYHIRRKLKAKAEKDKKEKYDFFIFGHPTSDRSGNPRGYASPNEFFHHLIWLIGGSDDRGYCACKLCNKSAKHEPESLKKRILASGPAPTNIPPVAPTTAISGSPALQSASMRRTPSASSTTTRSAAATKLATQPQEATTPQQQPVPLPTTQPQVVTRSQQQALPATQPQVVTRSQQQPVHLQATQPQVVTRSQQQPLPLQATQPQVVTRSQQQSVPLQATQPQVVTRSQQQSVPLQATQPQVVTRSQQQSVPLQATQPQVVTRSQQQALPATPPQVVTRSQQQQQQLLPATQPQVVTRSQQQPALLPATQPQVVTRSQQLPVPSPVTTTPSLASVSMQANAILDDSVIFREGEVVWYKNNNAWRIGLVLKTVPADGAPQVQPKCLVKPLAHAALQIENVLKEETDMRPFLAFSVPPVNMEAIKGLRMSQIDWQQIQSQYAGDDRQKQEIVGLEGSKMAVVEIDQSFSTFNAFPMNPADPTKQSFGGLFLGAERIFANEAVRIRLAPNEVNPTWIKGLPIVMALKEIYVTTEGLHFFGDIYRLEETASQQPPPNHGQLPLTMLREQQFRNEVRKRAGTRFDWIPIQLNQHKSESVIRGRFYETSKLMPILDPARYQAALSRSLVEDVQAYLNNRLDSAGPYMGRRRNRLETLSTAVPSGFFLSLGPGIVED